jgi:putative transposase
MARKLRIQYSGAIYHVMNRGDRREAIFLSELDRVLFLETLKDACRKTDWEIHAWCLMTNHFHLVVETPRANLVDGMQWLLGVYTNRFNHRHGDCGHLFSGRYKAILVEGSGSGYLKTVCDYVHLNPVRAGLIAADQPLQSYPWSSYGFYLKEPAGRPAWMRVDRLLGEWGIPKDSTAGRKEFAGRMEARRQADGSGNYELEGWCLGSETFRQDLLSQVHAQASPRHTGPEITESNFAKAERIVQQELNRLGWGALDMAARRKGDACKVQIAGRLRRETTMSLAWIAQRLGMGTAGHLACLLYRKRDDLNRDENKWF